MNDLRMPVRSVARPRRLLFDPLVEVVAAALVACVVTIWLAAAPQRAPDISIINDTNYEVTIRAGSESLGRWTDFAIVGAHTQAVVARPIDQGAHWVLDFGAGGQFSYDRAALQAAGWQIRVPPEVGDRLARAIASPSAPR